MTVAKILALMVLFAFLSAANIQSIESNNESIKTTELFAQSLSVSKEYQLEYFVSVNWFSAFLSCAARGLRLATVKSQEEQTYLEELIAYHGMGNNSFWLSGTDLAEKDRYAWFSSGSVFSYKNWYPGQPDNYLGLQNCVVINHRNEPKWDDRSCESPYYYICERNF